MEISCSPRKDGKYILQVLLPPNRGRLYVNYVKGETNQQPSQHLKELVFKFLKEEFPDQYYDELERQDENNWQEIVQRRVNARKKAKEQRQKNNKKEGPTNPQLHQTPLKHFANYICFGYVNHKCKDAK